MDLASGNRYPRRWGMACVSAFELKSLRSIGSSRFVSSRNAAFLFSFGAENPGRDLSHDVGGEVMTWISIVLRVAFSEALFVDPQHAHGCGSVSKANPVIAMK